MTGEFNSISSTPGYSSTTSSLSLTNRYSYTSFISFFILFTNRCFIMPLISFFISLLFISFISYIIFSLFFFIIFSIISSILYKIIQSILSHIISYYLILSYIIFYLIPCKGNDMINFYISCIIINYIIYLIVSAITFCYNEY